MATSMRVRRRMTAAEFDRLADTKLCELIDGVVRAKVGGAFTSAVNMAFGCALAGHVDAFDLGHVFDGTCPYQCFPGRPDTIRKPDVSFVRRGRFPDEQVPDGNCLLAPDFAVEVVAARERWGDVERKVSDFLRAGVPVMWVVNPHLRTLHAYTADGRVSRHADADTVCASPSVPGFAVRLTGVLLRRGE